MSASQPSRMRELWFRWKALRLPWRRKWLAGRDLSGVTYWEMHSTNTPSRPRRIAQYPRATQYADVAHSPAWMQWLRHTRPTVPSISEQQYELQRQQNLRQLVAAADQRWAEKPSMLDQPKDTGQVAPQLAPRDPGGYVGQTEEEGREGVANAAKSPDEMEGSLEGRDVDKGRFKGEIKEKSREKEDPWKKARGMPGEEWQPKAWTPGRVERR